MRAADYLVDLGPGAGEHGGEIVAAGTPDSGDQGPEVADRPLPLREGLDPRSRRATQGSRRARRPRRSRAQPQERRRRRFPVGTFTCVTGVSRVRQDRRSSTRPSTGRSRTGCTARATRPGAHDRIDGLKQIDKVINIDQSPIGRTPRSNPATYTGVFDHIRAALREDEGGAGPRVPAGPVQLQRQGRALRGLQGRWSDQDRDALPARRLRPLRALQWPALQPRDARGPLQGQVDRRRARDAGRGGGRLLRQHPEDPPATEDARRRRTRTTSGSASPRRRSPAARPSASSLRASCRRSRPGRRSTSSTSPPPGCTSPTSSACSTSFPGWSTPAIRWS